MTKKKCNHCNKYKVINLFAVCSNSKDGLQVWCKECMKLYLAHRRNKINKDKLTKRQIIYKNLTRTSVNGYVERYCRECHTWMSIERFPKRGNSGNRRYACNNCLYQRTLVNLAKNEGNIKKPGTVKVSIPSQQKFLVCFLCDKEKPVKDFADINMPCKKCVNKIGKNVAESGFPK